MEIDTNSASSDSNLSIYGQNTLNNNQNFYTNSIYCANLTKKTEYENYFYHNEINNKKCDSYEKLYNNLPSKEKNSKDEFVNKKSDEHFNNENKKTPSNTFDNFYSNKKDDYNNSVSSKKLDNLNYYTSENRKNLLECYINNNRKNETNLIQINTVDPFPKRALSFSSDHVSNTFILPIIGFNINFSTSIKKIHNYDTQ